MITKILEATNGPANWGKFLIGRFDTEWAHTSVVSPGEKLLRGRGWSPTNVLVLDLQTGEGAIFAPHGVAQIDLNDKHQLWVCPLFEPVLTWLYAFTRGRENWFDDLPAHIDLPDAAFAMYGYRRTRKEAPAR
jgi:hypothetical protein